MATTTTDAAGSDPIQIWESNGGGTEKARITAAGNVGIGTTSPATALNVNGSVLINATSQDAVPGNLEVHGTIRLLGAGGGPVTEVEYGANGASDGLDFIPRNYDSHHIRFDANGNVGIGTTSPTALLHVNGFARFKVPAARATNSADQTMPVNTATALSFDTNVFDNDNLHNTRTNNTRLTAPEAGIYYISAEAHWNVPAGAAGEYRLSLRVNGTTVIATVSERTGATGISVCMQISTMYQLSANDYIEVLGTNNAFNPSVALFADGIGSPTFAINKISD